MAQNGLTQDSLSTKHLWLDPAFATIMLKPLQLQPDFLNHAAQNTSGCRLRLLLDFTVNPADLASTAIWEAPVGTVDNPWIFHTPATPSLGAPTILPLGLPTPSAPALQNLGDESESGSGAVFASPPGHVAHPETGQSRVPGDLDLSGAQSTTVSMRLLVETANRLGVNQGVYLRWFHPEAPLGLHQTLYGFAVGQYFFYVRNATLEVYRDVSPQGDRSHYQKAWSGPFFALGRDVPTAFNAIWPYGQASPQEIPGGERSLMIIPYRRHRVLVWANTNKFIVLTTRAQPKLLPDGSDWDITRSDTVQVWGLTAAVGRFQVQKVKYESGPGIIELPSVTVEYTPFDTPQVLLQGDHGGDSGIFPLIQDPVGYAFPPSPISDDCPPPTSAVSGQGRTYGVTVQLTASSDQTVSPHLYGIEVIAAPVFQDNAAAATTIFDQTGAPAIRYAEISLGDKPGDGHATAHVLDTAARALQAYYYRAEMPVQMSLDGTPVFTGYTDPIEVRPWRFSGTPVELTVRMADRWTLLEETFLREQKDWQGVGHITVVDGIARQCGIDTGVNGSLAEYPAGWHDTLASTYDTPLGRPLFTPDNLEANTLLGWKPQPNDTGASYLRRIQEFFSGWLMGFRADGTFYYLPFDYFKTSAALFHAFHRSVNSGLVPTAGAGLSVSVSAGSATVNGTVTNGSPITISGLAPSTLNYLYLKSDGTGTSNTTGVPPDNSVGLGTATTSGIAVTAVDTTPGSGRQLSTDPVYRNPVEFKTIPPSGNVVQIRSNYAIDYTANRTNPLIDWASVKNPQAVNYLGRYKWFIEEVGGAFDCPQLNQMAAIVFKGARRKLKQVSFTATFVPALKIGSMITLEGYGTFRIQNLRVDFRRQGWDIAEYVCLSTDQGF